MARNGQITGISGTTQTARHEVTVTRVGDKTRLDVNVSAISISGVVNITQTVPFTVSVSNTNPITVNVTNNLSITQTNPLTVNVTNNVNITQTVAFSVNVSNNVNITQTTAFTVNVTAGTISISNSQPINVHVHPAVTSTWSTLSITGTNVVGVTNIANQQWLELHPLSSLRVYYSDSSSIVISEAPSFRKIDPFIRPIRYTIYVGVTASTGVNIRVIKQGN